MTRDPVPPERAPGIPDDDARTKEAKRVVEEYADALREILRRLRRWFN
jgi:hypothetical protein